MTVADDIKDAVQDIASSLNTPGPFRQHRLFTLAGYALAALLTLVWGLSGAVLLSNPIGAQVEQLHIQETNEYLITVQNESGSDWTRLSLQLNETYLYTHAEPIPHHQSVRVLTQDFRYQRYVPRAPRAAGWRAVDRAAHPGPFAPPGLKPTHIRVHTDQGEHTQEL